MSLYLSIVYIFSVHFFIRLNHKSKQKILICWLKRIALWDMGVNKHPVFVSTVRCLGGVSGSMLLGMTRDELKTICPDEGGRVFYPAQNIKAALAVSMTSSSSSSHERDVTLTSSSLSPDGQWSEDDDLSHNRTRKKMSLNNQTCMIFTHSLFYKRALT